MEYHYAMPNLLATMITTTSYGTWLAGDLRGYVESGKILPGNPERLKLSKHRMLSAPVYFNEQEQLNCFMLLLLHQTNLIISYTLQASNPGMCIGLLRTSKILFKL